MNSFVLFVELNENNGEEISILKNFGSLKSKIKRINGETIIIDHIPFEEQIKIGKNKLKILVYPTAKQLEPIRVNELKCVTMGEKFNGNYKGISIHVLDWETIQLPPGLNIESKIRQGRLIFVSGNKKIIDNCNLSIVNHWIKDMI